MLLLLIYVAALTVALSAALLMALHVRRFAAFAILAPLATWASVGAVATFGFRYSGPLAPWSIGLILAAVVALMLLVFRGLDQAYLEPYLRRKRAAAARARDEHAHGPI
jgi:hypothetical protein